MPAEGDNFDAPQTGETAIADESPEVAQLREQLESERAARLQAEGGNKVLREHILQQSAPAPAVAPQAANLDDETVRDLMDVGYKEEEARKMARVIAKREERLAVRFAPRESLEQVNLYLAHVGKDMDSRKMMEQLEADGYDKATVQKIAKQVDTWMAEGKALGSAEIAFNAATQVVTKGVKPNPSGDPVLAARALKMQGQRVADTGDSRGGRQSSGPLRPPKHIDEIKDETEWLKAVNKWARSLPDDDRKRVQF